MVQRKEMYVDTNCSSNSLPVCFLFVYDQNLYHYSAEPCGRMQRAGREQTFQHGQAKGLSITGVNQTLSTWSHRGASAPTVRKTEKSFHFSPRCKHPLWGLIIYAFLRVLMTHSNVRLCWVADVFDKINLLILWRNQWKLHSVLKVINSYLKCRFSKHDEGWKQGLLFITHQLLAQT